MANLNEIKTQLESVESLKIYFTDLNGRIMGLPVNPDNIDSILSDGIGFDGSSVAGFATVENSDCLLFPEPESFRLVKFSDETLGFFIGSVYNEKGSRSPADPRALLENVLDEAKTEYGVRFLLGPEHEFFLLAEDDFGEKRHSDKAGYFHTTPHDKGETIRNQIIAILKSCGIVFEKAHHEVTPSQHEINLEPTTPLDAADRTVLFNHITQKVAVKNGLHATFMPKPFDHFNRSAFHIHLSMLNLAGENLFYDGDADYFLSKKARQFIGGIEKYGREASIVMASTLNSYKAYVSELEAPIIRGWGFGNRSSMVRVPYSNSPNNKRLELRSPDPSGNVYLQMTTLIAMGLAGIKEELDCGRPDSGSTYDKHYKAKVWDKRFLPKSFYEALVEAERSKFLKELLGERIYDRYMELKIADWEDHRVNVTPLELDKYL